MKRYTTTAAAVSKRVRMRVPLTHDRVILRDGAVRGRGGKNEKKQTFTHARLRLAVVRHMLR